MRMACGTVGRSINDRLHNLVLSLIKRFFRLLGKYAQILACFVEVEKIKKVPKAVTRWVPSTNYLRVFKYSKVSSLKAPTTVWSLDTRTQQSARGKRKTAEELVVNRHAQRRLPVYTHTHIPARKVNKQSFLGDPMMDRPADREGGVAH